MPDGKIKAYYVASTHWDREWYEPFQAFRYHLTQLLDEVMDVLTNDERFACFQTDGQSIILEDYLEIRPERRQLIEDFAAKGKLRIGPWYTMPDENLVSGESLVRNLEEGIRVAREFGNVSKAGFVCDMFGHVSQIPQIFQNFGIQSAFLFRGVNEDTNGGLFKWQSPDGSELVVFRFGPKEGYFDYAAHVRLGFQHDQPFEVEKCTKLLAEYLDVQNARVDGNNILIFDGGDHMPIEPLTCDVLEGVRKVRQDVDIQHTGLDEFADAVAAQKDIIKQTVHGELRQPGRLLNGTWLIPGVYSSRVRQKQDNHARETELFMWAEPFSQMANQLAGLEYPYTFLRRSWRYLLENHAHDSICSCSPDQIHKDMEFRFDQSRLINGKLIDHALKAIARRVDLPDLEGEEFAMTVFNPTQADIDGPVDFELWFDEKTPNLFAEFFHFEFKVGFRLYDENNNEIPYDYLSYYPMRRRFERPEGKTCMGQECIVANVTAPLKIPAFGYTTIICRPQKEPTRHPAGNIVAGDRVLENEHLRLEVQNNGSISLLDKRTKQTYDRTLVFEERADIGDGWYHGVAVNDEIFSSTACHADVAITENGAQKATLRIRNRMEVPECFEFEKTMRRSQRKTTLTIDSYITLRKDADYLEVRTVIDNDVRDHRIRVLFESGAKTDTYMADTAFDVVTRNIALPADNHTYKELAVETTPQANWTAVFDNTRGLAVVAPALRETAVQDVPERPLALTLLRGYRRTIFTNGEEGGQSLGAHEFKYCLVPLSGEPPRTRLAEIAQRTAGGIRAMQVLPKAQVKKEERTLPRSASQLSLDTGKAIVASLRRYATRPGLELRMFNPYDESITETVRFTDQIESAALIDFEGNVLEKLTVAKNNCVTVTMKPKQIATVSVQHPET